jgi:hypothetical protein
MPESKSLIEIELENVKNELDKANETIDQIVGFNTEPVEKKKSLWELFISAIRSFLEIETIEDHPPKRPFRHWKIGYYTMESPDNKYSIWVANNFYSFRDHDNASCRFLGNDEKARKTYWKYYNEELEHRRHVYIDD